MVKIGVLALQGAVREHVQAIEAAGATAVLIKKVEQLNEADGLIIPGGESTTIRKLIDRYDLFEPLKQFAETKPVFGTCAGLILLAKEIVGQADSHLGVIDMKVERNSFGRQRESFEAELMIKGIADDFPGVFIRAPRIVEVGENVEILSKYNNAIVAVREGNKLACSFHPELTNDFRMAQYFIQMVKQSKESCSA